MKMNKNFLLTIARGLCIIYRNKGYDGESSRGKVPQRVGAGESPMHIHA